MEGVGGEGCRVIGYAGTSEACQHEARTLSIFGHNNSKYRHKIFVGFTARTRSTADARGRRGRGHQRDEHNFSGSVCARRSFRELTERKSGRRRLCARRAYVRCHSAHVYTIYHSPLCRVPSAAEPSLCVVRGLRAAQCVALPSRSEQC